MNCWVLVVSRICSTDGEEFTPSSVVEVFNVGVLFLDKSADPHKLLSQSRFADPIGAEHHHFVLVQISSMAAVSAAANHIDLPPATVHSRPCCVADPTTFCRLPLLIVLRDNRALEVGSS